MAQHIVRRGDGYHDRRIMYPARDWLIGLLGAAVLFLGSSVGAGYLFWSKSNAATEVYEVAIDPVHYDSKLIERVLTNYAARQVRYKSLREDTTFVLEDGGMDKVESTSRASVPPVANEVPLKVE